MLFFISAGCRHPAGSSPVRLAIGAQQSPSQLLIYVARELNTFRACGLEPQIEEFPGSGKAMEGLLGGSIDVVSGYHEQTMQLPAGAPLLQSFLAMTNGHMVALIALKVDRIDQLPGKKIGVTTLGSATHLWLNFLLRTRHIDTGGIIPVSISTAGRAVASMERGVVDAGVVSDFTVRTLEKRLGAVHVLADTRTPQAARAFYGVEQYPGTALFARKQWIDTHHSDVKSLACAVGKARDWVKSHTAEEVVARLPASHRGDDVALYTEVVRQTLQMLTPDGRITADGAKAASQLAGTSQAASDSYTNEFVQ